MENIYEYGEECLEKMLQELESKEFKIYQYSGTIEEMEDFVDLLEVMSNYKQIDWTIYSSKKDLNNWYIEIWDKKRNCDYRQNIRKSVDMEVDFIGIRKEIYELIDDLWLEVGPEEIFAKIKELKRD